MTDILDVVCKGTVITGPANDTFDVVCKGTIVIGPRSAAAFAIASLGTGNAR
jgi:hypothetical protein